MERVPEVMGLDMSEAIARLAAAGVEVHTASKGTVTDVGLDP
jgi:beta-lactam-binding protein with PASTA domain